VDRDKYFDIDKFLQKAQALDWHDLIDYCNAEVRRSEHAVRQLKRNDPSDYTIRKYYDFVHESTYFFSMGGVPGGMAKADFQRLKPIVEQLVAKGQWKMETLNNF